MRVSSFLASALALVLFPLSAMAADMPAPRVAADLPPARVDPVPVSIPSSWYIRGDVGVKFEEIDHVKTVIGNPNFSTNFRMTDWDLSTSGIYGAGVGYYFTPWLRADVTGEFRGIQDIKMKGYYTTFCGSARCDDLYNGKLYSIVALANLYADLGTWNGFTPYIGGGIGMVWHKVYDLTDYGPQTSSFGRHADKTSDDLAWMLTAGVSYDISPRLKLDANYRYMNLGDAKSGKVICVTNPGNCSNAHYELNDITSHDVRIGLRYVFGDVGPAVAPRGVNNAMITK